MSKKKKQIIIIAIILLLCIAVTTTVVLITRNSGRKQGNHVADGGETDTQELSQKDDSEHDTTETTISVSGNMGEESSVTQASTTTTEEANKPTTESGNTANEGKPTGGTTGSTTSQYTTTQPPVTQAPTTQTPTTTEQPSGGNQGNGNGGNTHQHTWEAQYRTIHHDEEGHYEDVCVQEAYDEPIYEGHYVCNYCGIDITATGVGLGHCSVCGPPYPPDHPLYGQFETQGSSYGTIRVQVGTTHHEAVYEKKWIVDKKAYDEQVLNGYKCTTCGATK